MIKRDKKLKTFLTEKVKIQSFNGSLLWEPWEILKNDGTPYKVYTPFSKGGVCQHRSQGLRNLKKLIFLNITFQV